ALGAPRRARPRASPPAPRCSWWAGWARRRSRPGRRDPARPRPPPASSRQALQVGLRLGLEGGVRLVPPAALGAFPAVLARAQARPQVLVVDPHPVGLGQPGRQARARPRLAPGGGPRPGAPRPPPGGPPSASAGAPWGGGRPARRSPGPGSA